MIIRGGTFGPVATNTYVVADDRGGSAWVVDPAMGSEAWVAQTLERLEVTPVAVLDTHGHWDHVVENHVWAARGLPVWVGQGDEDWVAAPAPFNPALFGNPPPTPGATPDRILRDGEVLELGDLRFRLIATPGHSPGCMVALEETAGDAPMMRSLERLFAEVPRGTRIHPGHGPWGGTLAEAEPYARMFM
jgi:hydroxyacylglutathione hydrolase